MDKLINPQEWRLSKSGFSIKTGWNDEKKVIAQYPGKAIPLDETQYKEWLENAQNICDLHNGRIEAQDKRLAELEGMVMVPVEPAAWLSEDGRVVTAATKSGMHVTTQESFCIPLYTQPKAMIAAVKVEQ